MDKWGIDKRCVSWWQAHNAPDKGNKVIAEVVGKYPDRFLGFAVINQGMVRSVPCSIG